MASYTLVDISKIIKVTRQTIYNWIHAGIIGEPKKNYRGYRVFNDYQLKVLLNYKNRLREPRKL